MKWYWKVLDTKQAYSGDHRDRSIYLVDVYVSGQFHVFSPITSKSLKVYWKFCNWKSLYDVVENNDWTTAILLCYGAG